jgi:hypothetical protein
MFLCEKCHKGQCDFDLHLQSRGPCESCGKVDSCADCKTYSVEEVFDRPRRQPRRQPRRHKK